MSLYLDASVLVPIFIPEATTSRLRARVAQEAVLISGFGAAEFSAGVARRARIGDLTPHEQAIAYSAFDRWAAGVANLVDEIPTDMRAANFIVRQAFALRAPDALHIAIAQRIGATLFTLDNRMAVAASALGIQVET